MKKLKWTKINFEGAHFCSLLVFHFSKFFVPINYTARSWKKNIYRKKMREKGIHTLLWSSSDSIYICCAVDLVHMWVGSKTTNARDLHNGPINKILVILSNRKYGNSCINHVIAIHKNINLSCKNLKTLNPSILVNPCFEKLQIEKLIFFSRKHNVITANKFLHLDDESWSSVVQRSSIRTTAVTSDKASFNESGSRRFPIIERKLAAQ